MKWQLNLTGLITNPFLTIDNDTESVLLHDAFYLPNGVDMEIIELQNDIKMQYNIWPIFLKMRSDLKWTKCINIVCVFKHCSPIMQYNENIAFLNMVKLMLMFGYIVLCPGSHIIASSLSEKN